MLTAPSGDRACSLGLGASLRSAPAAL